MTSLPWVVNTSTGGEESEFSRQNWGVGTESGRAVPQTEERAYAGVMACKSLKF